MTNPTPNSDSAVSSTTGKQWLLATKEPIAATGHNSQRPIAVLLDENVLEHESHQRRARRTVSGRNRVHITSVSIPDVSALPASISEETTLQESDAQTIAKSLAQASEDRLNSLYQPTATAASPMSNVVAEVGQSATVSQTQNEVAEPTEVWVAPAAKPSEERQTTLDTPGKPTVPEPQPPEPPESPEPPDSHNHASSVSLSSTEDEKALTGVIESMLERSAVGQPMIFAFLGSQENSHVDSTTSTVVNVLARRGLGAVLLVDGNSSTRRLSASNNAAREDGVVEAVMESRPWQPLVRTNLVRGVDFLPAGQRKLGGSNLDRRILSLAAELKQNYQFICVSVGESDSIDGRIWSEVADGCYLLISQKNANPTLAQSAVAELRASGARLLGCVVTDCEAQDQ